jgi:hypothetical protein
LASISQRSAPALSKPALSKPALSSSALSTSALSTSALLTAALSTSALSTVMASEVTASYAASRAVHEGRAIHALRRPFRSKKGSCSRRSRALLSASLSGS